MKRHLILYRAEAYLLIGDYALNGFLRRRHDRIKSLRVDPDVDVAASYYKEDYQAFVNLAKATTGC